MQRERDNYCRSSKNEVKGDREVRGGGQRAEAGGDVSASEETSFFF